jgi:hypothetical protein
VRLTLLGNTRSRVDFIEMTAATVGTEPTTWGRIKALYRSTTVR